MIFSIVVGFIGATMPATAFAQIKSLPDGLSSQGAGGAQFVGSGQMATLDCASSKAEIAGSDNKLTLTGDCTNLDMFGSGNSITIAFAKNARINVVGSNNTITWTTPDGKEPLVTHLGANNTITRGH